jgi:hypothetical protein
MPLVPLYQNLKSCVLLHKKNKQVHKYMKPYLEPYKGMASRYICPACHKPKVFTRYLYPDTGEHLGPDVGRCNRESKCNYHYTPKQYFEANPDRSEQMQGYSNSKIELNRFIPPPLPKPVSLIPDTVFTASLQAYEQNHLATYLTRLFGPALAGELISRYYIGTTDHWQGATVFYQIDIKGRIKAGKIMLYNTNTGKRVKKPYNHLTWIHSSLKLKDYNLQQCFFGEHLLTKEPGKAVAIVESEKTAIIASVYLPAFIWLATGSKGGLSAGKCKVLRGRKVVLYPDLNAFDDWSQKAKELKGLATVTVSDLLELVATDQERTAGLDLADYLIRLQAPDNQPVQESRQPEQEPTLIKPKVSEQTDSAQNLTKPDIHARIGHPVTVWDLTALGQFYSTALLPDELQLNECSRITNLPLFLKNHFATVKVNNGKRGALPYLERLQQVQALLSNC